MDYAGQLLIASPHLADPNFRQTVVLMIRGDEGGTLGLILNRESDKRVGELWEAIFKQGCETREILRVGGPVFGPLMVLHTRRELAELEVLPGLYFSTDKDHLAALIERNLEPFHFFVGNAGWGKKQLAEEIEQGAWLLVPATLELVFGDTSELWKRSLNLAGKVILEKILRRRLPEDMTLN